MNKYLTHLPISEIIREDLITEFYKNQHRAKVFTASNKIETRSVPNYKVIRNEDMEDCHLANNIASNISLLIRTEVKPRYYIQEAESDLNPHRDVGATVAINIILKGTGPVCFDNTYEMSYNCAILDVTQLHSVRTEDTRILFRMTMNDISYEEVLSRINEHELLKLWK
tara:strand:+ start:3026 stop:3532 length:507 start_codon:yes stop_codon:yes gene_type:complete